MNQAEVRRMTKAPRRDDLLNLPPQLVTVRCECGWYLKDVLVAEGSRLYAKHRRHQRHA